jgi:hypothetical protein
MLLKQEFFSGGTIQYVYRRYHPLLQFLPLKLAEWVANNLADELNLPESGDDWGSEDLNRRSSDLRSSDQTV